MTTTIKKYKTIEETATGTQRIIFHCRTKGCKQVFAYDYLVIPSGKWNSFLRHDETGKRIWSNEEVCPGCGFRPFVAHEVVGKVTEHTCGAKCRNAKGPICDCSCGGAHHGEGFLRKH